MRRTIPVSGLPVIAALAFCTGLTAFMAPVTSAPVSGSAAATTEGRKQPRSQRLELAQAQTGGGAPSSLPGGASSLNETYKDWRVACAPQGPAIRCVSSQVQTQQNGQRVLAIELNPQNGNSVSGTLVMPFGLALDSGVTLQIDDKPALPSARFRTCLPIGCIVSVAFEAQTLVALRAGTVLKVKATADGGAAAPFSISLQGLGSALDRIGVLSR